MYKMTPQQIANIFYIPVRTVCILNEKRASCKGADFFKKRERLTRWGSKPCSDHTFRLLPSRLAAWMLAVLRRDGKGRTLEHTPCCLHRPWCRQSLLQGEQIWAWSGPPWSLWEWTSAAAEWVQCHFWSEQRRSVLRRHSLLGFKHFSEESLTAKNVFFLNLWETWNHNVDAFCHNGARTRSGNKTDQKQEKLHNILYSMYIIACNLSKSM